MRRIELCLVSLLGALAFASFAGLAEAEESEWMIGPETLVNASLKEEKTSFAGAVTTLTATLSGTGIQCKETKGAGAISQGGKDTITLTLTGCEALKAPTCKVSEPVTLEAKSEMLEAGGDYYYEVSPKGTVKLSGEGCTKESTVAGSVAAEISKETQVKHPVNFSKATTKAVNESLEEEERSPLKLTYGGAAATLEGNLTATLSGEANAGEAWHRASFTKLCKIKPSGFRNNCGVSFYPKGTWVDLEKRVNMKFKFGVGNPVCTTAKMEGQTDVDGAAPLTGTLEVNIKNCVDGMNNCTIKSLDASFPFWFDTEGQGLGRFGIRDFGLELTCAGTTCKYRERSIGAFVFGSAPPLFSVVAIGLPLLPSQPGACAANLSWEGPTPVQLVEFEFSPKPFFITGR